MRIAAMEKTAETKQSLENGDTSIDEVTVDITNGISTVGLGTQWFADDTPPEAAVYERLSEDIRSRIKELKKERDTLEQEQGATFILMVCMCRAACSGIWRGRPSQASEAELEVATSR